MLAPGDEVAVKKPAPDVHALALDRLNLLPERAIAFADSRNGLLSAQAAGPAVIATPSAYTEGEDFGGAWLVLTDLTHLGGLAGLARGTAPPRYTTA